MSNFTGAALCEHNDKENISPIPVDQVALKRAKNTEAARKSRAKKIQERDELRATVEQLKEELHFWWKNARESEIQVNEYMARATNSWRLVSGYRLGRTASSSSGASLEIPESPQSSAAGSVTPEAQSTCLQDFITKTFDEGQDKFVTRPNRLEVRSEPNPPVLDDDTVQHIADLSGSPSCLNSDVLTCTRNPPRPPARRNVATRERTRKVIRYTGQIAKRQMKSSMKGARTRNPYLREMAKLATQHVATNVLPYDWQRARRDAGDLSMEDPVIIQESGKMVQRELVKSIYDSFGRSDCGPAMKEKEWMNGQDVIDLTED